MVESKYTARGMSDELSDLEKEMFEALEPAFEQERLRVARLLAGKDDNELFGETEFELRDRVHHLAARSLEKAVEKRQKKGRARGC